ncbi:hypothetical protein L6452_28091 [Arctium lappa]|uniref:Uncharacterized protein n=1 Tax=Arctium lappa TaxID=4217 RepID=A0ACB9A1T6_ARCLA|nr:hypothetical protein L6452_28091 [Arctium lappa]
MCRQQARRWRQRLRTRGARGYQITIFTGSNSQRGKKTLSYFSLLSTVRNKLQNNLEMAMPLGAFPTFVTGETASPAKYPTSSLRLLTSTAFQANLRTTRTFVTYATVSNPATEPKKRVTGLTKTYRVSPELKDFLGGKPEISRSLALKEIWAYIKEKELQEPTNRKVIVCDEKLKTIFGGKERVGFLQVSGLISPHFLK